MTAADTDRDALQGAVHDLLSDLCSEAQVRAAVGAGGGIDDKLWARLTEMGVLELAGAGFRTAAGASHLDLVVVFEELGRFVAPVPALSTAVGLAALDASDDPELTAWASDLASGARRVAVALGVQEDLVTPTATVRVSGADGADAGVRLDGHLTAVPEADGADGLLVLAATASGPALFLVAGPGLTINALTPFDLSRSVADVVIDDAPARLVAEGAGVAAVLRRAWLLLAAEQIGVAQRALDAAVSYAKLRAQFGRAIGSFQAVKHSCVDMLVKVEGARQLARDAATALDADSPDAALAVSLAAAYASEAAVDCTQRCLQIHGGIGFTWEHGVHLGLRKAKADSVVFADAAAHWQHVTDQLARRAAAETA
jgi:alkylation response protein AidB-like acyl-CoA dehydrogenase